jgi:hypothetical protein
VIVDTTKLIVEYLDVHLAFAFVEEVYQASDLNIVGAGKLLPVGLEVHLAFPVEHDLHGPSREVSSAGCQPTRNSANLSKSFFLPKGSFLMRTTNSK